MHAPLPPIALALALALVACGDSAPEPAQPATYEDAVAEMTERVQATGGGAVEPIAAAELATRLPDDLLGMSAEERSHQDVGAMGMKMSMATAEYRSESGRINASVTDVGGIGKMAPMAAAWSMADFDRTTSSGYERTIRFEGHKGMESSSTSGGRLRTELSLLLGERVVLRLEGIEVDVETLKKAAAALDLVKLARGS
jgi:hypothetical protein